MFDDPKKELEKLQKQLLEEEEWFQRELDSAKAMLGDTPARRRTPGNPHPPRAAAPNPPRPRPQVQQVPAYDREELGPRKKGIKGLVILAVLETLGIVGIAAYWLLYLL